MGFGPDKELDQRKKIMLVAILVIFLAVGVVAAAIALCSLRLGFYEDFYNQEEGDEYGGQKTVQGTV